MEEEEEEVVDTVNKRGKEEEEEDEAFSPLFQWYTVLRCTNKPETTTVLWYISHKWTQRLPTTQKLDGSFILQRII